MFARPPRIYEQAAPISPVRASGPDKVRGLTHPTEKIQLATGAPFGRLKDWASTTSVRQGEWQAFANGVTLRSAE
jgi:hypothetical protein